MPGGPLERRWLLLARGEGEGGGVTLKELNGNLPLALFGRNGTGRN